MELRDQAVIVTGGSSGLGKASVDALLEAGARVAVFDLQDHPHQSVLHLGHSVALIAHAEARENPDACRKKIAAADIVAAAVPDGAIETWRDCWLESLTAKTVIHFSGAIRVDGMFAFHPLYSFPPHAVDPEDLEGAAFAGPKNGPSFEEVFPGAPNPHFRIADEDRARYHALAVLSGNFAAYLWNETASEIGKQSGLRPDAIMAPYLGSIVDRFLETPEGSLTGPIARKDENTVAANLNALVGSPKLKSLYEAFLRSAWSDYSRPKT